MPVTSSNKSLQSPLLCHMNASLYPPVFICFDYPASTQIFNALTFTNMLLVPLYICILRMGLRRWRKQSSATSGTTSHSDIFTYNIIIVDIVSGLGSLVYSCAIYTCSISMKMIGYYTFTLTYPGQTFFQCLTCLERYMAVVHPVTYRGLSQLNRVRIRNISIGCVLLMCVLSDGLAVLYFPTFPSGPFFIIYCVTILIVIFCSVSVLCVLIRLGLSKVGGDRQQTDQSKRRAFNTILVITGTLALRSCGLMFCNVMFDLNTKGEDIGCVILMCGLWLCLPSSLVLPLLFLRRAGKLSFSCKLSESKALKRIT